MNSITWQSGPYQFRLRDTGREEILNSRDRLLINPIEFSASTPVVEFDLSRYLSSGYSSQSSPMERAKALLNGINANGDRGVRFSTGMLRFLRRQQEAWRAR